MTVAASLAALLARAGGAPSAARVTAGKVLRLAYGEPGAAWDAGALSAASVGAWARPALLALDAALAQVPPGERLTIVAGYTPTIELREEMHRRGWTGRFWEQ